MIEFILEIILEILCDLFAETIAEIALEFGLESLSHSLRRGRSANPVLAGTGFMLFGAAIGFLMSLFFPERIIPATSLKGISLIVSPLGAGTVMHAFGKWRRSRGCETSFLATFWGGALFAFSMAVTRWIMVGRFSP
ncbi:MAG TPA: hypothetical protein ENK58_07415 [Desulfobacterales bacterium]|nr:hypothetical protein [Desulfobacterales bacterium]